LDKKLNEENLTALFKSLDTDRSGSLDLKEFSAYLDYSERLQNKIKNNIDSDTQAKIDQDIDRLFRKVDADHSGFVDIDELYQLLKPLRPGKISRAECEQIVRRFDANNDGQLDREEFHEVVKAEYQENLTKNLTDVENYKKIFRLEDTDKDGQLTRPQFKNTILTKIDARSMSEPDLDELISFLDQDGDGFIVIDEFFVLLQNSGSLNFAPDPDHKNSEQGEKNKKVQRCLLEIRQAMSFDLFEYFAFFGENALPKFFEPSFLQHLLEKEYQNMPAKGVLRQEQSVVANRKLDFSSEDPLDGKAMEDNTCLQITVQDIDNVPVPKVEGEKSKGAQKSDPDAAQQGGLDLSDVYSREVRAVLFDPEHNTYISNTYILPASCSTDPKTKKTDATKWTFRLPRCTDLARQFRFKNDGHLSKAKRHVELLFELVLTIKPKNSKNAGQKQ